MQNMELKYKTVRDLWTNYSECVSKTNIMGENRINTQLIYQYKRSGDFL